MKKRWMYIAVVAVIVFVAAAALLIGGKEEWEKQYDLGVKYMESGDYESAILAFNAAIEIDPSQEQLYIALAASYEAVGYQLLDSGNLEEAYAAFRNAQTNDPERNGWIRDMAGAFETLGSEHMQNGRYQEAIDNFQKAYELAPEMTQPGALGEAYTELGEELLAQGDYEGALEAFEKALEYDSGRSDAVDGLIDTWIAMADEAAGQGNYEEAIRILEEALQDYDDHRLITKLDEIRQLYEDSLPVEPGSDRFFERAAEHVTYINTDMHINGVRVATANIDDLMAVIPGAYYEYTEFGPAYQSYGSTCMVWQYTSSSVVDMVTLKDVLAGPDSDYVWVEDQYLGGIQPTDTLEQALTSLGFTPEEIDYLEHCVHISLYYGENGVRVSARTAEQESGWVDESSCNITIGGEGPLSIDLEFEKNEGAVDRTAVLDVATVHNHHE
ncbi:MAG: tetratricopeptide repeat protein [Lachnospiraceae bacterium]|nr:tetratricopeptide repeat protein [Lachnospiraceae bacterium]